MHYYCYSLCPFTCKSMQCNAINFTNYILYRWSFFDLDLLLPFYRSAFIHWWILSTLSNAAVTREQPCYEINKINKSSPPCSVPAVVSDLRLDHNGSSDSLKASWSTPRGGVDHYLLTLSTVRSTSQERRLPPNVTQAVFEGLTPGCSYELSIKTIAGEQSSETRTSGRTGTQPCSWWF